jgi:hypothetical protein
MRHARELLAKIERREKELEIKYERAVGHVEKRKKQGIEM